MDGGCVRLFAVLWIRRLSGDPVLSDGVTMDYKNFYDAVSVLYSRAQHGAISGDEFCYQVGLLLDNPKRQNEVKKDCNDSNRPVLKNKKAT